MHAEVASQLSDVPITELAQLETIEQAKDGNARGVHIIVTCAKGRMNISHEKSSASSV